MKLTSIIIAVSVLALFITVVWLTAGGGTVLFMD